MNAAPFRGLTQATRTHLFLLLLGWGLEWPIFLTSCQMVRGLSIFANPSGNLVGDSVLHDVPLA